MLRFAGAVLRGVALAVFALALVVGLPPALLRTVRWSRQAASVAGEDLRAVRSRALGEPWVAAIDRLRAAIPPRDEYLLVDAGTPGQGAPLWVRFELAPRRARLLGTWSQLPPAAELRHRLPADARWVVIAFREPQPPLLLDREGLLRAVARLHGGG